MKRFFNKQRAMRRVHAGFSLVEVLVALVVVSIGLLGLAKMETLAISSADISGNRAIAAMQASSLAAAMHADHDYWQSANATQLATVTWNTGTSAPQVSDATLIAASTCNTPGATACNPLAVAAADLQTWGNTLYSLLPGYIGTIACTPLTLAASPPTPVTCTITITWQEGAVGLDANQTGTLAIPTYTLNVQP